MFGRKKSTVATYSKTRPVQIAVKDDFLTPDGLCIPSSNNKISKRETVSPLKGFKSWMTPLGGCGSSLALRNISNIPLEKTLSRTPCVQSQQSRMTGNRLVSSGIFPAKVSSKESKDCKTYRKELQRAKSHSKKGPLMKCKHLISTTTYSSKSMSCCSICGGAVCSNEHSLSTVKSMSLCKSCLDDGIIDDVCDEHAPISGSQVSQPHNSTLVEEDMKVELKDIIPQDLSAIMEEPAAEKEQVATAQKKTFDALGIYDLCDKEDVGDALSLPRCSTPVDPGKIPAFNPVSPDHSSPMAVIGNQNYKAKSKSQELESNQDLPNITPETLSKQECVTTKKLKQKRKLAYSKDMDEIPDCTLLHANINRKRPIKLLFNHNKSSFSRSNPWTDIPIDILIHTPVNVK